MGGGPNYLRAHMRAVQRLGFEPHAFSLAGRGGVYETDYGTLHLVPSPFRPHRTVTAAINVPLLSRAVVNFGRETPGVAAIHGMHIYAAAALLAKERVAARPGIRAVAGVFTTVRDESTGKRHAIVPEHGAAARAWYSADDALVALTGVPLERKAYRGVDAVFLNYDSVRRRFAETHGRRSNVLKLKYAPESSFTGLPCAPVPAVISAARGAGQPVVVVASRHDPRKGVQTLIHALSILHRRETPFFAVLTGDGVLLRRHREMAAHLGLCGAVHFTGAVSDPLPYIAAADVFVQPSLQEGSGSVAVLEAMQAGVAVIASGVDGLLEDIEQGVDGILTPPGDAPALARTLERLFADEGLRRSLGTQARRTFEGQFSARAMTDSLGAAYESIGVFPDGPVQRQ